MALYAGPNVPFSHVTLGSFNIALLDVRPSSFIIFQ
jgi:hypothetical protein